MKLQHLSIEESYGRLQSGREGLSEAEAARRLTEYGPNTVERMKGEPLTRRFLKEFIHFFALILWFAAGMAFFAEIPLAARDPLYLQATAACLTTIVITQVANVFACRSERESVFALGLFSNRLIWWGIAFEIALILCIDYTKAGQIVFGTAALPFALWAYAAPFAVLLLLAEEGRKAVVRKVRRRGRS